MARKEEEEDDEEEDQASDAGSSKGGASTGAGVSENDYCKYESDDAIGWTKSYCYVEQNPVSGPSVTVCCMICYMICILYVA